jgi:hypothetical protein
MKLYMFRRTPLPIIRSLFTVHSAMVYVILKFHKWVKITSVCNYICVCNYTVHIYTLVIFTHLRNFTMTYTNAECTVNNS